MQPTQVQVIQSIVASLDEHIAPDLTGSMARSQLLTIQYLLDQLRLRVLHEAQSLAEFELDARETLALVRPGISDEGTGPVASEIGRVLEQDVPTGPAAYAMDSLEERTTTLRRCIDKALRALPEPGALSDNAAASAGDLRRALHDCIARQLEREAAWLQSGYAAPRR